MKRSSVIIIAFIVLYYGGVEIGIIPASSTGAVEQGDAANRVLLSAIENRRSDVQVTGYGEVTRVLADDNHGSRHQRFILEIGEGQTLLVAHNIDLANRISSLAVGDRVEFNGEYEWNAQGGVVHWTHHDPQGRHTPGWLKHGGQTFQ